jgi:hypothetical protein
VKREIDASQMRVMKSGQAALFQIALHRIRFQRPGGRLHMSENQVIANQKTIVQNQKTILANQSALRVNQTTIKKNQAAILKNQSSILKNQNALQTIIKNQKDILARLK